MTTLEQESALVRTTLPSSCAVNCAPTATKISTATEASKRFSSYNKIHSRVYGKRLTTGRTRRRCVGIAPTSQISPR